ncbi:putative ubiquitin-protein ligase (Asi3) [Aspergillus fijiensis CBS 313.89]|uniref:Ubiquitin-protein ligase n=1 Tax=Aspergillus fijiensis CBS 313.89 TaxID=1448319 RepID=A0A8G1RU62_9EURO|nr:ubiquitin-protein ligase [Aspergillus fijiensis CBS 313.89]RAK76821.1 ubiquitin-protein ligase [Aspergillus fijiensis CBS 313.89]
MSILSEATAAVPTATSSAQSLNTSPPITATSLLSTSPRELLSLPLRGLSKAETFAFSIVPKQFARMAGLQEMATHIWGSAPATGSEGDTVVLATQAAAEVVRESVADAAAQADSSLPQFSDIVQAVVKFSGFFSYLTGRWSLACFTVSLVLNRITIYASTRRRLQLDWSRRFALRIIPIVLFIAQIHALLRALRCQTSPDYSLIRYGKPNKRLFFDYAGNGGFLYTFSSALLPWETDEQSCSAVHMGRPVNASDISYGSFRLLWPAFLRLCISHFVETLCCALQGRSVVTEAGMSIFEHSLAFAEAESTISQSLGLGIFGLSKQSTAKEIKGEGGQSVLQSLSKAQALERMNVSPELLLITLISCCNSLTSNLLDVFGKQSQYRLVNTTFWGICFMSAIAWGTFGGTTTGTESLVFRIPTVCLVGFVPHLFILLGILICVFIYALALVITAFSLPVDAPQNLSLKERFSLAHENMQGANQIQSIRFNRHDDFYTTSLRIGYGALTAARQAVFLNEGRGVVAQRMTWLERDRLAEIELMQRKYSGAQGRDSVYGDLQKSEELQELEMEATAEWEWESGYAREKKIETTVSQSARTHDESEGVGAFRGVVRCYQSFAFFRAIFHFLLRWTAYGFDKLLSKIGINRRPQWLKSLVRSQRKKKHRGRKNNLEKLDFWIMSEDGVLKVPANSEFDVESEMRRRESVDASCWGESDERRLDEKLYDWWRAGGAWGNQDQSPDYVPSAEDWDDTTSVVSMATTSDSDWEAYESDGRRTPTQEDPYPGRLSREDTPVQETLVDLGSFARLLDPRDQESRQEARILAAHLAAGREGRIMTRRQFQQQVERDRAQVLLTSRFSRLNQQSSGDEKRKPTPDEETEILEKLILSQRSESLTKSPSNEQTWESGASGLGPSGPPCVICQTSPRSIITWPCRCLCICEDCRVSLAMNNFGSCVTCRREVGGFVRLWVP